ncbi:MAG TPA: formyltransferase family protein, partial [Phycisphaeraceae bacterium]
MRLIFLGSGEFGLPTLQQLAAQHQVALVVTQPDRPAGRRRQLTPTPVAAWAQAQGLAVLKAQDVNEPQVIEQIAGHRPDASIVIAFGQKLSPQLISVLGR